METDTPRSPERQYEVIAKTATIRNKRYRHGDVVTLSEDAARVLVARNAIKLIADAEPVVEYEPEPVAEAVEPEADDE